MTNESSRAIGARGAPGDVDTTRRSLLRCAAWAGTGVLWTVIAGVPRALALDQRPEPPRPAEPGADFQFVQISDTHIGFRKAANPDPVRTLQLAIDRVNALPRTPSLVIHTGDITHLAREREFDDAAELLKYLPAPVHYVPGEHDVLDEGAGKLYLQRHGRGTRGNGWYSFDDHGVHFIALVNVFDFRPGRQPLLGDAQLRWLAEDLRAVSASTPIVVFAHIPLWTISSRWGWGTADGERAIALMKRHGSVTVLNGHVHQVIQKVEGNITFHTARATAYPQPAPGTADAPGPLTVPADRLASYLGVTAVRAVPGDRPLAIVDSTLA